MAQEVKAAAWITALAAMAVEVAVVRMAAWVVALLARVGRDVEVVMVMTVNCSSVMAGLSTVEASALIRGVEEVAVTEAGSGVASGREVPGVAGASLAGSGVAPGLATMAFISRSNGLLLLLRVQLLTVLILLP